jgi:hypothetical protein
MKLCISYTVVEGGGHIDRAVKLNTMDVKNEKEGYKEERRSFATKQFWYFVFNLRFLKKGRPSSMKSAIFS